MGFINLHFMQPYKTLRNTGATPFALAFLGRLAKGLIF
jgi:hypothetical protein